MPMYKRLLCVLLTVLLLLSLLPAIALPSMAASRTTTSEACIEVLKEMEGFIPKPIYDNGQYSVGYGSRCEKDDYPDGITKEEADALLREYVKEMEEDLNAFAKRYSIIFAQHQFDALMLFTYNCGPNWMYTDGIFRSAVIEGKTGNAYIYPLSQWSSASSQLHLGLVNRRLIEADMYLNGSYENKRPSNYTYVIYDNNEGVSQVRVQGYDCNLIAYVQAVPTRENHRFLGWYTAAVGGSWVTELTAANSEQTLYAHWQANDATEGTAASYSVSPDSLVDLKYYGAPNGTATGTVAENALVEISADFVDADGIKWGCSASGWVKLGSPRIGTGTETEEKAGVKVTVTGDYVNVRSGPGTNYAIVAAAFAGEQIYITDTRMGGDLLWGKFRAGWLCLQYTDYDGSQIPEEDETPEVPDTEEKEPIATGTVTANELNIRVAPGTQAAFAGVYRRGDKVAIYEKTAVGNTWWGMTEKGWICLTYVLLDKEVEDIPETTEPETTGPEATEPETTDPDPEPEEPTNPSDSDEEDTQNGIPATVTSKTGLNIRSGPGTNYLAVGSYTSGQKILILEQVQLPGASWGRTDKGWVSMTYVKLDENWTNSDGVYATVISKAGLNVRSGPGVGNPPVGSYSYGQKIVIFQQQTVSGVKWGRTDLGWVCMDYVTLDTASGTPETEPETTEPSTPETPTEPEQTQTPAKVMGTVTANGLNIRKAPGTNSAIVGGYQKGDRVEILDQTLVNSTPWGLTDRGWICLAYVKLDETSDGNVTAGYQGTITATILCIRKGPGTGNAIVGTYLRGNVVTILDTTKVGATLWGRTDQGWICMDYVK